MKLTILVTILLAFMTAEARFGKTGKGSRARGSGTDGGGGTAVLCWADNTIPDQIRASQPRPATRNVFHILNDSHISQASRVELYDVYLMTEFGRAESYDISTTGEPRVSMPSLIEIEDSESIDEFIERLIRRYDASFPLLAAELREHHEKIKELKVVPAPHGLPPAKDVIVTRNLGKNCLLATMISQDLPKKELEIDFRIYKLLANGRSSQARAILHEIVLNRLLEWNKRFKKGNYDWAHHEHFNKEPAYTRWQLNYDEPFDKREVNKLVELLVNHDTTKEDVLQMPFAMAAWFKQRSIHYDEFRYTRHVRFSTNRKTFETYLLNAFAKECFDNKDGKNQIRMDRKTLLEFFSLTEKDDLSKYKWFMKDKTTRAAYLNQLEKRKDIIMDDLREKKIGETFLSFLDRTMEEFRLRIAGIVPQGKPSRRRRRRQRNFSGKTYNKSVNDQICQAQKDLIERIIEVPLPRNNW